MVEQRTGAGINVGKSTRTIFLVNGLGMGFSVLFTLLLTNTLSVVDYGTWAIILSFMSYFGHLSILYGYWGQRFIAKGSNVSKTCLGASGIMSAIALPAYIILMWVFAMAFNQPLPALLLSAFLVILELLNDSMGFIVNACQPQKSAYILFIIRGLQVAFAALLIYGFGADLAYVIVAATGARVIAFAIYYRMNRPLFAGSAFNWTALKSWMRAFWVPLSVVLTTILYTLDVLVVGFVSGSTIPVALFSVAFSVFTIILTLFSSLSTPLYSRVLATRNLSDGKRSIGYTILATVAIASTITIFSKQIISLFGPNYSDAWTLLIIFSWASIFEGLYLVLFNLYQAMESKHEDVTQSTVSIPLRSSFSKGLAINVAGSVAYLTLVGIWTRLNTADYLAIVMGWGALIIILDIALIFIFLRLLRINTRQVMREALK